MRAHGSFINITAQLKKNSRVNVLTSLYRFNFGMLRVGNRGTVKFSFQSIFIYENIQESTKWKP